MNDILQNNSRSKKAESGVPSLETATPVVPDPQQLSHLKPAHIHLITQLNWRQLLPPQVLCCVDHPALTDLLRV